MLERDYVLLGGPKNPLLRIPPVPENSCDTFKSLFLLVRALDCTRGNNSSEYTESVRSTTLSSARRIFGNCSTRAHCFHFSYRGKNNNSGASRAGFAHGVDSRRSTLLQASFQLFLFLQQHTHSFSPDFPLKLLFFYLPAR